MRTSVHHRFGVFGHFTVEQLGRMIVLEMNGIEVAGSQTPSASHTMLLVYAHLAGFGIPYQPLVGTLLEARLASPAELHIDFGLSADVHLGLSGP